MLYLTIEIGYLFNKSLDTTEANALGSALKLTTYDRFM